MTTAILTAESDGVLTITLNRPEVRNAMSQVMIDELLAALASATEDPNVRIIVLRGAGGHFSAGGDIKDMAAARMANLVAGAPDPVHTLNSRFGQLALAFSRSTLPIVAVLEGAVMGGGFGLACTADVVIASTTVELRLPETSLGLVPAQIAPFLIERLGYSEAKRLAVLGGRIDADEALMIRLVHRVLPPESLEIALYETLETLRKCAPAATAATKRLFHHLYDGPQDRDIEHAASVFCEASRSAEAVEGVQAFLQKRTASWAVDP